jgi:hypothetical protein
VTTPFDQPLSILFENVYTDYGSGAITTSWEDPGWPFLNCFDYAWHTASRWRAATTPAHESTDAQWIQIDLGIGGDQAISGGVVAGHNINELSSVPSRIHYSFETSTDAITWTQRGAVSQGFYQRPFGAGRNPPVPQYIPVGWSGSTEYSARYHRVRIYSTVDATFLVKPVVGSLTAGRVWNLQKPNASLDWFSKVSAMVDYDNENGEMIGRNYEASQLAFDIEFGEVGLSLSDVLSPVSGQSYENFAAHIKSGKPFWLIWHRPMTDPDLFTTFLCKADEVRSPFLGTSSRRDLILNVRTYREAA